MKAIFKVFSLLLLVVGFYYLFDSNLGTEHRALINKNDESYIKNNVFAIDSENRGYSDQAKELMDQDLIEVNNDQVISKLYVKNNIQERKIVLSKTKNEFLENFITWSKIARCLNRYLIKKYPGKDFSNFYNESNSQEKIAINLAINALSNQYTSKNSVEEDQKLMNSIPTNKECEDVIN